MFLFILTPRLFVPSPLGAVTFLPNYAMLHTSNSPSMILQCPFV